MSPHYECPAVLKLSRALSRSLFPQPPHPPPIHTHTHTHTHTHICAGLQTLHFQILKASPAHRFYPSTSHTTALQYRTVSKLRIVYRCIKP